MEKLADAVFSTPGAGIVGPMSNAAGYPSLPAHRGGGGSRGVIPLPPGPSPEDMNRRCGQWTPAHLLARVPLAHAFCFSVTREAIETLGGFDGAGFPGGYLDEPELIHRENLVLAGE